MAHLPHRKSYPKRFDSAPLRLLSGFLIGRTSGGLTGRTHRSRLSPSASDLPKGSRVQRRLKSKVKRDRIFLNVVRSKRRQVSQLRQKLNTHRAKRRLLQRLVVTSVLGVTLGSAVWTNLFIREQVTFGGVPYRIVHKFWNDKSARDAYFIGDRQALHDRLKALGVEEDIKDYYRDRFDNEHQLDRHIHQIMFDRTGYVGEAYKVDNFGQLSSIGS
ncbi:MAG: hypothetical protein ACFB16_09895 [Phormidesmis sp.]